jgi:uncharacterized protein (TIGR00251 family)
MKVKVKVKPGAPGNRLLGLGDDGTLLVAIGARPVNGEANQALVRFLARAFGLSPGEVRITSGARSRTKVVELPGITPERIKEVLE